MSILSIQTETSTGQIQNNLKLEIAYKTITLKELFEQCIVAKFQLVARHVQHHATVRTAYENTLNVTEQHVLTWNKLDPELALQQAIKSFEKNSFIVLVDEKQILKIEEKIDLAEHSTIQFIKLLPLVGG